LKESSSTVAPQGDNGRCRLTLVLRIGACACFSGWAWQHLVWSAPYDAALWNPDLFGWLANALSDSWESYVAEIMTDQRIGMAVRLVGLLYLAMAVVAWTVKRDSLVQMCFLGLGGGLLAWTAFCKCLGDGCAMAILLEQGGQVLSPVMLILALRRGVRDRWTIRVALIAFCATFAGHGVYASGLAPTPGHFYGMVSAILGLGEQGADIFLKTVGILDFVVCAGVFVPALRRASLAYAALWGLLTALARPVAGMSLAAPWWGADQFLHEAVYRAPHAALPLFLLLALTGQSTMGEDESVAGKKGNSDRSDAETIA